MICRYTEEEYNNAKSNDLLRIECEYCGAIFMQPKKAIAYELLHHRNRCKYCSVECSNKAQNKRVNVKCLTCGKEVSVYRKIYNRSLNKHFFCCKTCSARYNNKIRNVPMRAKPNNPSKKTRICKVCGNNYVLNKDKGATKSFCSKGCADIYHNNVSKFISNEAREKLRKAGVHSAHIQKEARRSRNEIYFCQLCEKHFKDVKHNEPIFNGWDADVILPNEKFAILWNGKWHYEKLTTKHSVIQTQNRDRIKIMEILKYGYKPYIIKDLGKYNKAFVEEEFDKFKSFLKKVT